ncbi:MAG TPA: hypothetical protein VHN99_11860 [Deinococcales bacterium]|nr:hypothetical protein [Deinococcales bacterium]
MDDLTLQQMQATLEDVERRAREHAEAWEWATGQFNVPPTLLVPTPSDQESLTAYYRLTRQIRTFAPRAKSMKAYGAIGSVTWGGDGTGELDDRLQALDLDALARRFLDSLLIDGMAAGVATQDPDTGKVKIARLAGHVEPMLDPDDRDDVEAIYQAWQSNDARSRGWNVRVYDLDTNQLREWRGLNSPAELGRPPSRTVDNAPPCRYQMVGLDADGLPRGELHAALPVLRAEWAAQLRSLRTADSVSFPRLILKGMVNPTATESGPNKYIEVSESGDVHYLQPGDLSQLFEHHDRILERLVEDLQLPPSTASRGNMSGEALRERRLQFTSSCAYYAALVQTLLTDLVSDYCALLGIPNAPNVQVSINSQMDRADKIREVINLYDKGLLSLSAAVRTISPFFPVWSDEEVEAFITANESRVTLDQFATLTGPGNGEPPAP